MSQPICCGAFRPSDDYLWVTWSMLTACNYMCPYCNVRGNEIAKDATIDATIAFLQATPQSRKEITLFGGEPTVHHNVVNIARRIADFAQLHVFTNFSSDVNLLLALQDVGTLSITYHPDMLSSQGFLKKLKSVRLDRIDFVNVMMWTRQQEWIDDVCTTCRELGVKHRLVPIWGISSTADWFRSAQYCRRPDVPPFGDVTVIYENGRRATYLEQECVAYGLSNFKGYTCYAGRNSLYIDHMGRVYRCQADARAGIVLTLSLIHI